MAPLDDVDDDGAADIDPDDEGEENSFPVPYSTSASRMPPLVSWSGSLDVEELSERLLGLEVDDAEEEAREALNESTDGATDADVLAVLLTVFKADRESAIHGEDSWERPLEYCKRMCSLCDRNFLSGGGQPRVDDFPARVVASVYAECGRTHALAGQISSARDLFQKALNVFALLPEPNMDETLEISACRGSLARVLRRAGQLKGAQDEFLQAMQLLADVPDTIEVSGLVSEYAETLASAGNEAVASPDLLNLISQMVEEKFGEGSDEHIQALQELSDACLNAGKQALAAPIFMSLARQLRSYYGSSRLDSWAAAEIQAVEEKAAQALETSAAEHMQDADFEAAASMWSLAIRMREALNTQEEVLSEMRSSLAALKQAAAMNGSEAGGAASTREPAEPAETDQDGSRDR
ncbi:Potassium voltage-gated channel protein eag [Durusdinium trenchii]|uniref:Potassium voltage-gated channel protein eag n=1 Tax=Durusdinium trenchii TaxID=1381693 RepID=A0ABP0LA54_9DINO